MIPTINKEFLYQKTIKEQLWNIFRVYDNDNITIMFMGQLDSDEEVVVFGDNQFNQCSPENKDTIRLTENDNILPITEINYYTTSIDYLDKNNEKIEKITAFSKKKIVWKIICAFS